MISTSRVLGAVDDNGAPGPRPAATDCAAGLAPGRLGSMTCLGSPMGAAHSPRDAWSAARGRTKGTMPRKDGAVDAQGGLL